MIKLCACSEFNFPAIKALFEGVDFVGGWRCCQRRCCSTKAACQALVAATVCMPRPSLPPRLVRLHSNAHAPV